MKKLIIVSAVALALGGAMLWPTQEATGQISYQTQPINSGEIRKTVAATGTLAAVDDVVVGAQLSGQITDIYVDFNDTVSADQLLAKIDPRTFQARLDQSQAQVAKTQADLRLQRIAIERAQINADQALRELHRAEALVAEKHISEDELDQYQTRVALTALEHQQAEAQLLALQATLQSNEANRDQAQIELDRTEIRAPIDGFVINRTIEAGQTVAASLNTPELFTLAKDLAQMEIEAYIDESDIGQIALDQRVEFNVDAFPDRQFQGKVQQIRRAPQSNSGVVSYTVIISANNRAGQLLPGMTANLELQIDTLRDTQRVPNAAIRLADRQPKPEESGRGGRGGQFELLDLTAEQRQAMRAASPQRARGEAGGDPRVSDRNREQSRQRMEQLLDTILTDEQKALKAQLDNGTIRPGHLLIMQDEQPELIAVQFGISDGDYTAVLSPDLTGLEVVTQMRSSL
ncbi:efflux RND transporter periplasmic adaptor subunit [Ferrimonas pelagia]|uniref:HlyD family secretion protein n=1 Tax=Ferrimonas pelagia TaxID=1177826 RepID=A0ABP9E7C7_9GAMM